MPAFLFPNRPAIARPFAPMAIDRSTPLGAAVAVAFPLAGNAMSITPQYVGALTNGAWMPSAHGGMAFFQGANLTDQISILSAITPLQTIVSEGSFVMWVYTTNAGPVQSIQVLRDSGSNRIEIIDFHGSAGLNLRFRYSASNDVTYGTSTVTGTKYLIGMTWSKAADQVKGYVNGLQVGSTATGLGTAPSTLAQARLGNTGTSPWVGHYHDAIYFKRPLTALEMWSLYDPASRWQVYQAQSRPLYFDVARSMPPFGRLYRPQVYPRRVA